MYVLGAGYYEYYYARVITRLVYFLLSPIFPDTLRVIIVRVDLIITTENNAATNSDENAAEREKTLCRLSEESLDKPGPMVVMKLDAWRI